MLHEAVSYYHELLQNEQVSADSRRILDDGLERSKLIFGGRRLTPYLRPHFVTESDWHRITGICETVWGAIQKVKDAAVKDETLIDELGLTEIERELVLIDPGYKEVSPTARLDSFLTEDSYSYVELNGESPAGIAYADAASEVFQQMPIMQCFRERYRVRPLHGRRLLLDTLLRVYQEFNDNKKAERPPQIAIVDLKGLPTQKEFELFREFFEQEGYPTVICSPDELEFSNARLRHKDLRSTSCTSDC